jgi:hypothetical protein
MKAVICPFCGVVSDVPHETQRLCIEALQAEIARTRRVLQAVTEPLPPPRETGDEDPRVVSGRPAWPHLRAGKIS